jgi:quercetin dioxygenase-like cupin family protein
MVSALSYIQGHSESNKKTNMGNDEKNEASIFAQGEPAPADYFTGPTRVKMLVPNNDVVNTQIANVVFESGSRTNWHTHPGGQILIVTEGVGYYQEKGKQIQVIRKGDVITIAPELLHWHGASAESGLTHIAVNPNTQKGAVNWLDRVTDEEYHSLKKSVTE